MELFLESYLLGNKYKLKKQSEHVIVLISKTYALKVNGQENRVL